MSHTVNKRVAWLFYQLLSWKSTPTSCLSRFALVLLPTLGLSLRELHCIVPTLACSYVTIHHDLEPACLCHLGQGGQFIIEFELEYFCAWAE